VKARLGGGGDFSAVAVQGAFVLWTLPTI
jgi:hypothetical protein